MIRPRTRQFDNFKVSELVTRAEPIVTGHFLAF